MMVLRFSENIFTRGGLARFASLTFAVVVGFCALLFVGCSSHSRVSLDSFSCVYAPRYASGFEVLGSGECASTILRITQPWQGAEGVELLVFVARDGELPPADFEGQVVVAPASRVVVMSSSHIAMLEMVGEADRVVGASGLGFVSNESVVARAAAHEVVEIGYDGNMNYENIVAATPDLALLFGLSGAQTALTAKLEELSVPYVYVGDYVEQSPLGKAEWAVVVAELVGRREVAEAQFCGIEQRYLALKQQYCEREDRPVVMVNAPYRDVWFMPSAENYVVQLIEDAGGSYILPNSTGSATQSISLEEAYVLASRADFWLNTGWHTSMDELISENPKFGDVGMVHSGDVFNNNFRSTQSGGSDFWESGVTAPDVVLRDLIDIFNGDCDSLYYYRRLK